MNRKRRRRTDARKSRPSRLLARLPPPRTPPLSGRAGPYFSRGSELLREWRKQHGLTQVEAMIRLRFKYDKLSGFELGNRRPSLTVAVQLRTLTGIPTEAWLEPPGGQLEDGRAVVG